MVMVSQIPPWLSASLDSDGAAAVAEAVRFEETTTSGEFVPMVVRRSIAVGHVFPLVLLGFWLAYTSAGGAALLARWRGGALWWSLLDLAILSVLAWFLSRASLLRRFLTSKDDIDWQVMRRAEFEFAALHVAQTRQATGVLLFVSLTERRAVVLADRKIAALLPPEAWARVVDLMVAGTHRGNLAEGLINAIHCCGELVRPHFPAAADDRNELCNRLVIKE